MGPKNLEYLLGFEQAAVASVMGREPDEVIERQNGHQVFKYEDDDIREIEVDQAGRIIRCNYREERRQYARVTPAHFISVTVTDSNDNGLVGMALDMSAKSIKIRTKTKPYFREGAAVALDMVITEAGLFHHVRIPATTLKIQYRDEVYRIVFLYGQPFAANHPYLKYIDCRCSEIVHGKKRCEYLGGKCKANSVKSA